MDLGYLKDFLSEEAQEYGIAYDNMERSVFRDKRALEELPHDLRARLAAQHQTVRHTKERFEFWLKHVNDRVVVFSSAGQA